jgi:hypothetical protein
MMLFVRKLSNHCLQNWGNTGRFILRQISFSLGIS